LKNKYFLYLAFAFLIILILTPVTVYAASTTLTFGRNRQGWMVRTQDAFLPDRNITVLGLHLPESIVFDQNDFLYIADTGNRRIVIFDTLADEIYREIRYEGFNNPRGVFVTPEMILYVADSGAAAIFLFDLNSDADTPVRTFGTPTAMAFGDTPFWPSRIAVDVRGNMYVIGEGVFEGIIQLSSEGEFLGFFASNQTTITFVELLQDIFFTDRQREGLVDRIPLTFSNVTTDSRGVVFSTSVGLLDVLQDRALKRHDMAGRNTFTSDDDFAAPAHIGGIDVVTGMVDVAVDSNGFIYTADVYGFIDVFNNMGELMFFFGAGTTGPLADDIAGWFSELSGIAVSSAGHIWALDRGKGFLQSFTPTEYALMNFEAMNLFNEGLYDDSGRLWSQVLRHNQMSVMAHTGLGRAYLYQQEFALAQQSFFLAGDRVYYSQAFWETRNIWLLNNLTFILIGLFIYFAAASAIRHFDRKKVVQTAFRDVQSAVMNSRFTKNTFFAFTVAGHPLDSFYYLKLGQKGSVKGAIFHFFLLFVAYMLYQTSRGFLVQLQEVAYIDFTVIIGGFLGLFVLFIGSNYLVTSINDGEGTILDIFKMTGYAMLPMTITFLAVTILSHGVTENELFLLDFVMFFGFAYTVVIMWLGLQETHNYSFGTTFKSLLITAAFMLIAVVILFNMVILFNEIMIFVQSIGREVYVNVTGLY